MAPPRKPWFRFYVEAVSDPKLRSLSPTHRWLWVSILAAARSSCEPGILLISATSPMDLRSISDLAGVDIRQVKSGISAMEKLGMLSLTEQGAWSVTNWASRQFESDTSTERTGKHRAMQRANGVDGTFHRSHKNVPDVFPGTRPDPESESDPPLVPPNTPAGGGSRPPDGNQNQESTGDPALDRLVARWVEIVDPAFKSRARAEARWRLPSLRAALDDLVLDECMGRCAAEATDPPRSIRYLEQTCRAWARQNAPGLVIPDPPAPTAKEA